MRRTRIPRVFGALVALCVVRSAAIAEPPVRPRADIQRVLIVSIDGMRPDVMLRSDMPTIDRLLDAGTSSLWARTTDMAVTLPSHTSMLTGVPPEVHGVDWNNDLPPEEQKYPKVPTIFQIASEAGYSTGLAAGKSKFVALTAKGVDWSFVPAGGASDGNVAIGAAGIIAEHKPDIMMVHFGGVDGAGHSIGWGTLEQRQALAEADKALGKLLQAYTEAGLIESTLVIISADHGGAGRNHGRDDMRSRYIPWIASGPGVIPNQDLTRFEKLNVRTEDTFATAAWVLGLTVPEHVVGTPVKQIFPADELMEESRK